MWAKLGNAITADLAEFVNTVQNDTQQAVAKVIGETDEEAEEISFRERKLQDLKRWGYQRVSVVCSALLSAAHQLLL